MPQLSYFFTTDSGVFSIIWQEQRWRVRFNDEDLGSYSTPEQALDDLVGGHTFTLSDGTDTTTLGLPDTLSDWRRVCDFSR